MTFLQGRVSNDSAATFLCAVNIDVKSMELMLTPHPPDRHSRLRINDLNCHSASTAGMWSQKRSYTRSYLGMSKARIGTRVTWKETVISR